MDDSKQLHRVHVYLTTAEQWYAVMRECRSWFGKNWRCQGRVKRKFVHLHIRTMREPVSIPVWFEVPDPRFATWISVKLSLQVQGDDKFKAAK